jgi:hypothetical protein
MNSDSEDPLLDDVLSEGAAGSFRQALLENTLRAVRRRRRFQKAGRGFLAAAAFFAVVALFRTASPAASTVKIVRTKPLPSSMIVTTRRDSVVEITSSQLTCHVVETRKPLERLKEINDDQLLALTAGLPAALIRDEANQVRLVFSDSPPEQESETPR